MGQAKRRGTFEQRRAEAEAREAHQAQPPQPRGLGLFGALFDALVGHAFTTPQVAQKLTGTTRLRSIEKPRR